MKVLAILTNTTNPKFTHLIGMEATIAFEGNCLFFHRFYTLFRTSYVKSLSIVDNVATVTTRNSIYTFKLLEDTQDIEIVYDRTELENQIKELECTRFMNINEII